ncbi:TnsA endonuclease N-terminal domain-containing protein [Methylotenera sp. G11]|uniref:TnsA endonuclease N-terminal domain-containing protein n=1 Tax=Methylotenera sp. G11 TaxID=1506585 RepID=UPI000648CDB1|nr:TnsA endonuclease N-terminal domain-containing protein [Methylotenera sp. G11]
MNHTKAVPLIQINFPKDGKIRSRKVVSRSNSRNTGKYPSWKMQRMMQWESIHEGNAMRILDASSHVTAFHEQPCEIIYSINGEQHRHYPDFMVIEDRRREFWEVKTEADANSAEVAERTALLTRMLPEHGYSYRIVLAEVLARQPRLDNVKRLNKLGRQPVPMIEQERIRRLFAHEPVITWGMLEQATPQTLRNVSRLILEGKLSIDLNQPISFATSIHSNFNAQH